MDLLAENVQNWDTTGAYEATSSLKEGEPSSSSKIVKITHQQTFGLLLSNCYCLVFKPLLSDLSSDFLLYLEL